ncbi:MAG TPA: CHAD domain-containing protein [Burkholderiales bacterium]|nr:CHAD domain-containing protein [Burkholderiales bacterium]
MNVAVLARVAGLSAPRGARGGPVKSRPAALTRAMTVSNAFRAVMAAGLAHLLANERGLLRGTDPEYLHQARVALRRLRSALDVFSPPLPERVITSAARELRWLASCLGPARDWDVFSRETLPLVVEAIGAHRGLRALGARCERLRRGAGAKSHSAARSSRYRRLKRSLAAWILSEGWLALLDDAARAAVQGPITSHARNVLEKRYQRVRKRGRGLDKRSGAELHRLRIAVKKFRYAADFFSGLYEGGPVREMLRRLARLQDILGAMNDAATAADLTKQSCRGARGGSLLEARGMLLGWSRGRAATLRGELKDAWQAFQEAEKFW